MSPKSKEQFEEIREASREKIMEAALELFANKGYQSTSITEIGRKAGISKGLMYHYFDSKEQLLRAMIDAMVQEGEKEMASWPMDDPTEALRGLFTALFHEMRQHHQKWRLLMKLTLQIDEFDFIHELAVNKMKGFLQLFEGLLAQRGLDDPRGEAIILAALMDGIAIQYHVFKEDFHLDEMEQALIRKYCES